MELVRRPRMEVSGVYSNINLSEAVPVAHNQINFAMLSSEVGREEFETLLLQVLSCRFLPQLTGPKVGGVEACGLASVRRA